MLVPAALFHYPAVFDFRFAGLLLLSDLGAAWFASRFFRAGASRFMRPWFAVWIAYAGAISLPAWLFVAIAGRYAYPPAWTPFWPPGVFLVDPPLNALTDGLFLASVPAAIVAWLFPSPPSAEPPSAGRRPADCSPACCTIPRPGSFAARAAAHAGPLLVFVAAAWLLSFRIPQGALLGTRVDPLLNVWNCWWFRKALFDPSLSVLRTDYVYQPFGTSFLWHTLAPLNCLIGIGWQAITGAGLIGTYNFLAMMSFALMGWAGYLLGRKVGCPTVGFFAGFAIMFSGAHLGQLREGHLDLSNAEWLIFFILFALRAFERGKTLDALAAGVFWVAAFYTHFYHAIFCALILGIMVLAAIGRSAAQSHAAGELAASLRARLSRPLPAALLLVACAIAFQRHWSLWAIIACIAIVLLTGARTAASFSRRWLKAALLPAAVFALAAGPWLIAMYLENASDNGLLDWGRSPNLYSTDLLGYLVPCPVDRGSGPFEFIWGRFLIPCGDSSAFLGFPVIALALYALRRARQPFWLLMAAAFIAFSFGPKLHAAGGTLTNPRLPYVALDAMPFLAASGVAGRYSIVATIGVVMVAAAGLAHLMAGVSAGSPVWFTWKRSLLGGAVVLAVLLISYPPFFFYEPPRLTILDAVRRDPAPGNVLPLCAPDAALWFQTLHGKKMFGGFASRVDPKVRNFICTEPVFREVYYGKPLKVSREEALAALRRRGVRWIITADARPRDTVENGLGLQPVAVQQCVYLYRLE